MLSVLRRWRGCLKSTESTLCSFTCLVSINNASLISAIRNNAEQCTRSVLNQYAGQTFNAVDYFDDGTVVKLRIEIDKEDGSGLFDFTGTGPEVLANFNAPPAITRSAILYCLKCLSGIDIPMNAGVLAPLKIIIPDGSVLKASPEAAVSQG